MNDPLFPVFPPRRELVKAVKTFTDIATGRAFERAGRPVSLQLITKRQLAAQAVLDQFVQAVRAYKRMKARRKRNE
jgi:hypothetical protein